MSERTVCFSGHRPEKLVCGGDETNPVINRLKSMIYKEIYDSWKDGYTVFISGLARGVDMWAAEMVADLKRKADVKLICVKPYKNHGYNLKGVEKWRYNHILENADETVIICDEYRKNCMRLRNEYMIEHSSKLIAVVSDYRSGTGQTIRLAEKKGIESKIIDLNNNSEYFIL